MAKMRSQEDALTPHGSEEVNEAAQARSMQRGKPLTCTETANRHPFAVLLEQDILAAYVPAEMGREIFLILLNTVSWLQVFQLCKQACRSFRTLKATTT
jgi:hypothetical protein